MLQVANFTKMLSKTSQNVQKLVLLNKTYVFFEKKMWFFWKIAEGSKFTVECKWYSRVSEYVQKLVSYLKKILISRKNIFSILETANGRELAVVCNWVCKISQNVKDLGFLFRKNRWVFRKKCCFSFKNR